MTHYLALTAIVETVEDNRMVYGSFSDVMDSLYGKIPSITLTSHDLESRPAEDEETFDENTMFKVYDTIMDCLPMNSGHARMIIEALQNAGILFRERR